MPGGVFQEVRKTVPEVHHHPAGAAEQHGCTIDLCAWAQHNQKQQEE